MTFKKQILIFSCIIIGISPAIYGQNQITQPKLESTMQASYANPALIPDHKTSLGLPVLSSFYGAGVNSGFTLDQAIERGTGDTNFVAPDQIIENLDEHNYIHTGFATDLFSLRFKVQRFHFFINVTEHVNTRLAYPKDLIRLIWRGNADFIGETADLTGLGMNMTHYREYGLGAAWEGRKWSFGARLKYLQGFSNISLKNQGTKLKVGEEMYRLQADADLTLNTSLPVEEEDGEVNMVNYITNQSNKGIGLDAGATYQFTDKWQFSASIQDLGFINWKTNAQNYNVKGNIDYSGFDVVGAYISGDSISENDLADSLEKAFNYSETENSYQTWLSYQVYLGAQYKLAPQTHLNGTVNFHHFKKAHTAISLGISQELGHLFQATLTNTFQYGNYNAGLGFVFTPGPFQLYAASDNILPVFQPTHSRNFNIRAGLNLVFGKIEGPSRLRTGNNN